MLILDEMLHHLKNPWGDDSHVNTHKQWFQSWFHIVVRIGFRNHPQYPPFFAPQVKKVSEVVSFRHTNFATNLGWLQERQRWNETNANSGQGQ